MMKTRKKIFSLFLSLVMLVGIIVIHDGFGGLTVSAEPASGDERKIKINDDWRFSLLTEQSTYDDTSRSLDSTGYADAEPDGFMSVDLPHDWSIYQDFVNNSTWSRPAQGALAGGTAWYRKTFVTTGDLADKNVILQFDSVQMVSQIYINGIHLGNQQLGYVSFEYDVTQYLRPVGEENIIAVKVMSDGRSARWYAGAGIYGSVYLIATDKIHIPVYGVYVATVTDENNNGKYDIPDFNNPMYSDAATIAALKQRSSVNVRTEIENKTETPAAVSVKSTVYDRVGDVTVVQTDAIAIAANGKTKIDQLIHIDNPKLWSVDDPNLYWVRSEIIQGGSVIDTVDTRFGIRYLYWKPGATSGTAEQQLGGLFLNGERIKINGVCEHRDLGSLGMETYQAAIDRRILKLKSMGVNSVRSAHNPLSPEYLEAADRLGMLVMNEGFDQWFINKASNRDYSLFFGRSNDATYNSSSGASATGTQVIYPGPTTSTSTTSRSVANMSTGYGHSTSNTTSLDAYVEWYDTELMPNAVRDIQQMVKMSRNSPAVYLWSSGNEILDHSFEYALDTLSILSQAIKEVDSLGVYSNTLFTSSNPGVGDKVSPVAGDSVSWRDIIGNEQGSASGRYRTIKYITYYPNDAYPASQNTPITAEPIVRYSRPITGAPPTWASEGPNLTSVIKGASATRSGMERIMSWADIGGDNYDTGAYVGRKDRNPWLLVGGTENASAFYTRGIYTLSGYRTSESSLVSGATGSYPAEWPFHTNFQTANVSLRGHRDDTRPFVYGEMVWTGHDYLGEPTPETWTARSACFGIIDTAGFEKDAFYMYKSAWTDIPTVRLLPQRWNWDLGTEVPVMIYTNASSVRLYLNDVLLGTYNYNRDTSNPIYINTGYHTYQPGELKAVAYSGTDGTGDIIATDAARTAGSAQTIDLKADRAFIENDGYDLVFIEANIRDSAGVMLPLADNRITWNVTGGEIVALDNGDTRDHDKFRPSGSDNVDNPPVRSYSRKAFNGKTLAIIKADKGSTEDIVITATATDGSITLYSNVVTVGARSDIGDGYDIYDYERPEVATGIGIAPELPSDLRQIWDNGLIKYFSITSWDLSGVNLNTAGTYTAYGTAEGTDQKFEAIVHVKAFSAISDVYVTTIAGIAPPLPRTVTVNYDDNTVGAAPVTWVDVSPSLYAAPGSFTVSGRITDTLSVTAYVTVKALLSIDDVTIYAIAGQKPEMPVTVDAKFTDDTEEPLGVVWDLSSNDLNYPGIVKVTGSVLDSNVTATAWVHVQFPVYASDLSYTASPADNVKKDEAYNSGQLIEKGGSMGAPPTYHSKGFGTLGTTGGTEITIDISGRGFQRFNGIASISAASGPGSVESEIYVDGTLVFTGGTVENGGPMTGMSEAGGRPFDVDVTGASSVKLVTYSKGSGAGWSSADDVADWCDIKFLSTEVTSKEVRFDGQNINLFRITSGQVPELDKTVIVDAGIASDAAASATGTFKVTWPALTASMFSADGVKWVYGRVEGTANGVAIAKVVTNYRTVRGTTTLPASAVGEYRAYEGFDYSTTSGSAPAPVEANITRSMIDDWSTVGIENNLANPSYGFAYGVYPTATNATSSITLYAPDLKSFRIRGVGNFQSTGTVDPQNLDFTIETSADGSSGWTTYSTSGTNSYSKTWEQTAGDWRAFNYTLTGSIPDGHNYIRITWPQSVASSYWRYNLNGVWLSGGDADTFAGTADLLSFKLDGYDSDIDLVSGAITVTVPEGVDITNMTPVIDLVSKAADYTPKGPQDFSNPVVYTVTNGAVVKTYTVTVARGYNVTFWLNDGNIAGDTSDVVRFVTSGTAATEPANPTKVGYTFDGWGATRDAAGNVTVSTEIITADTTFYARYTKSDTITIYTNADATLKTWQTEKNSNYGGDSNMLVRQTSSTGSNGLFGENFTTTSTSDGTDIKSAYIRFNLASLKDVAVNSATLHLRYNGNTNSAGTTNSVRFIAARVDTTSPWSESSITWNTRTRTLSGDVSSETSSGVARTDTFNATSGTAIDTNMDVINLYNSLPDSDETITFAVTINSSARDFYIRSKEGAGSNVDHMPRLVLGITPKADYQVIYDLNGGSGAAPLESDKEEGMTFTAASIVGFTGPDGKTLKEWNTQADGLGTGYEPGATVTMGTENVTLYAIWTDAYEIISSQIADGIVSTVTIKTDSPADTELILASYDSAGKLVALKTYQPSELGQQDISVNYDCNGAALVRAFLWSKDMLPLCDSKEIFVQ